MLVRPDRRDEPHRWGRWVGSASGSRASSTPSKTSSGWNATAPTLLQGLWVRTAQRLLALAAGIWFNWQLGIADKRSLVAYDH